MNYQELLDYLAVHWRKTVLTAPVQSYDFAAFDRLLAALGRPQHGPRYLHVTGSKGKGSTAYLAAELLRAHGLRTGLFTSPHLVDVEERIRVDGAVIPRAEFAAAVSAGIAARDRTAPELGIFPAIFAAALTWFRDQAVEVAVVEVRSGGRYDPTNIIPARHQAITAIEAEHVPGLGWTVAEIADQKSGVIKPGSVVTTSAQRPDAAAVIAGAARAAGATLRRAGREFDARAIDRSPAGTRIAYRTPGGVVAEARLGLLGDHQVANAAVAIAAVEAILAESGRPLDPAVVDRALAAARWPARLDRLSGSPPIVYDGAHTPESARSLATALLAHFGPRRWQIVLGLLRSKNPAEIAAGLAPAAARVLTVPVPGFNAHAPDVLAERVRAAGLAAEAYPSLDAALADAAATGDPIAITGTLYLYQAARAAVAGCRAVHDPV